MRWLSHERPFRGCSLLSRAGRGLSNAMVIGKIASQGLGGGSGVGGSFDRQDQGDLVVVGPEQEEARGVVELACGFERFLQGGHAPGLVLALGPVGFG